MSFTQKAAEHHKSKIPVSSLERTLTSKVPLIHNYIEKENEFENTKNSILNIQES